MKPYTTEDYIRSKFNSLREQPGVYLWIDYQFHPRSRASRLELIRNLLFQNDAVINVKIGWTNIGEASIIQLLDYLAYCPKLESIGFVDIPFNRRLIDALLVLLQTNPNISLLSIWRNDISQEDLQYLLLSIVSIRNITGIRCNQPHLAHEVLARSLVFMLQHPHMRHLTWVIRSLHYSTMQMICHALRLNETVKELHLMDHDQSCVVKPGALNPLLTTLRRRGNHIDMGLGVIEGDHQLEMLASFLQRNNSFRKLTIKNSLTDNSLRQFANAIQHNNSLTRFHFEDYLRGSDEFDSYEEAIDCKIRDNREFDHRLSHAFAVVSLARIFLCKAQPTSTQRGTILTLSAKHFAPIFQEIFTNIFTATDMLLLLQYASQSQTKLRSKYEMSELLSRNHLFSQASTPNSASDTPALNPIKRRRS